MRQQPVIAVGTSDPMFEFQAMSRWTQAAEQLVHIGMLAFGVGFGNPRTLLSG